MGDARVHVLALLERHGWNATSFQALEPHFQYWFDGDDAVVAYVDTGRAWVAAGAPVAAAERVAETAGRFLLAAEEAGRRGCFFAVESRFRELAGLPALLVGEQPVWDPQSWAAELETSASLRAQLRRALAKGVTTRVVSDGAGLPVAEMETLVGRWLAGRRMPPMGFLVPVHPFEQASQRKYVLAEADAQLVAFLVAVPVYARGGWLFEDLVRDPGAPNGTIELLIDTGMRSVAAEGCRYVTLGLVPLAGEVSGWLRVIKRATSGFYNFAGLQAFKAKLRPSAWHPLWLAFPKGRSGMVALYDVLSAFAHGGLVRFGVASLLRAPAPIVRALAVLLIPWTLALGLVDAERWFPAPWVKWAWFAFDAGLALGLFALTSRWRRGLATLLAVFITLDAFVTALEIWRFNLPRAGDAGTFAVLLAALVAPTLAATLLWSSRLHPHQG